MTTIIFIFCDRLKQWWILGCSEIIFWSYHRNYVFT